jgi:membrane dipeptidase
VPDAEGPLTVVLHLEGAECIDADLDGLDKLYDAGLRSLGPVWSRPNAFAHGVPFRTASDGDTGPGLTEAGRALVRECTSRGMVVDCSHITAKGFWDIAEEGAPLVATHSNACEIALTARNLTDAQLKAVGETGGMVGLNFGTMFLRPDGKRAPEGRDRLCHPAPRAHGRDGGGGPRWPRVGLRRGTDARGAGLGGGIAQRSWRRCRRRALVRR